MLPTCRHCCVALHYSITSRAFRCLTPNCPMLDVAVDPSAERPRWVESLAKDIEFVVANIVERVTYGLRRLPLPDKQLHDTVVAMIDRHRRQGAA